ncbi:MAG: methyltransferase domain [Satyrvirus sp.]|uniref:Methyltransferase domain n=1 Tax=Satyrvirus sp. TaxID=2487771 RepID=A0A3G5AD62_9VIRU|nr:MAG: methyltransferase domain [Satyrvirus sp.]
MNFPYKKNFLSISEINKKFELLKKYRVRKRLKIADYKLHNIRLDKNPSYKCCPFVIITFGSDYSDFDILSDYFNEKCRMQCVVFGHDKSPLDFWEENRSRIIKQSKSKYHSDDAHHLRESLYDLYPHGECTSHRPILSLSLVQLFHAKSVLDPCAGWGDRLIGILASKCKYYCGVDPNPCVHEGYKDILAMFNSDNNCTTKLIESPFETAILPDVEFDLVYTSPPYFNMETYDKNSVLQSTNKYQNEKNWFENFLKILLDKSIKSLKHKGHLCININQKKGDNYIYWMLDHMKTHNEMKYNGILSYAKQKLDNPQPIFVWSKRTKK